ncbi:MAG: hypothetical protein R2710_26580 [Acidimicrobiales bacterium]
MALRACNSHSSPRSIVNSMSHVAVLFEAGRQLGELGERVRIGVGQRADRQRRTNAGNDVFALGVGCTAPKARLAGGRIASEDDAGASRSARCCRTPWPGR